MSQTDLKSDDFCSYSEAASQFFWVMAPKQYENTYAMGEVGISAAGGTAGSFIRSDVIDISSFLSGRDDLLSKCQPPVPGLDDLNHEKLKYQNNHDIVNLIPKYTKEKRSATDLSAIDYNRWQPLHTEAQNLRFVIEDFSPQRGGLDTSNYSKLAWNKNDSMVYKENSCNAILPPGRACGPECESVSGFPGKDWITGEKKSVRAQPLYKKPSTQPNYPFSGPYSQDLQSVGVGICGENFFHGPNYDKGSCPIVKQKVLTSQ